MVIMALDHVRDYFHLTANTDNPLNLDTTTPWLYATRWITHFCAPVFVLLSGTSIYLQSLRKSKKELSLFLIKRGLWLVLVEVIIITFAWSFNPHYTFFFLQVIWVIGVSMILLGLIIYLPFPVILVLGMAMVAGHDLLDFPEAAAGFHHALWRDLLHTGFFTFYPVFPNHTMIIIYPLIPWTGVMMLGYCLGRWFSPGYTRPQRQKLLLVTGFSLTLLFIAVRASNLYGDPVDWSEQKNTLFTFFSFMNVNKYPPSLLYLCITLGPALIVLALIEPVKNAFTRIMAIYGRVAFFYYVIHIYVVHLLSAIFYFMRGHTFAEGTVLGNRLPFYFLAPGEGYGLPMVYLIWLAVVILLFPLCRWYDQYKSRHRDKWWLSYL